MTRLARIAVLALPLVALAAPPASAEVKTRDRTQAKFELPRLLNMLLGKAKDPIVGTTAVKGNRKITMNDFGGTIVDLSEEKVYTLDVKKKQYTVKTFDQIRKEMREAREKASKQAESDPESKGEAQKPQKEVEFDFDVKETGQKKQIAGYDTRQVISTLTVREKGRTLEDGGGMVITTDQWLGPNIPALKELADFEVKYWKQLEGPEVAAVTAEQMAMLSAFFPMLMKASERLQQEGSKLSGTALDTTVTFEAVKSAEQMAQSQEQQKSSGGGLGGMLAKKIMKSEPAKKRSSFMTTHHEILEVATSVPAADLAIPADFKEKK